MPGDSGIRRVSYFLTRLVRHGPLLCKHSSRRIRAQVSNLFSTRKKLSNTETDHHIIVSQKRERKKEECSGRTILMCCCRRRDYSETRP